MTGEWTPEYVRTLVANLAFIEYQVIADAHNAERENHRVWDDHAVLQIEDLKAQLAAERKTINNLRIEAQQYKRQIDAEREKVKMLQDALKNWDSVG